MIYLVVLHVLQMFPPMSDWFDLHPQRDSSAKNENSVIIYLPSGCSKPVIMYLFCWTQRIYIF